MLKDGMGGGGDSAESVADHRRGSVAASAIFMIVLCFQFLSKWLDLLTAKKGSKSSSTETHLREEIKQLLKEASAFSQPSTFAQAAKLRRLAAVKEKELANYQESHKKEMKVSHYLYMRVLFISKVITYFVLICWFWRVPIATISQQLVQPFGKMLSWKGGGILNGNVMVGVIPWLILSTRVSKFVCRLIKF